MFPATLGPNCSRCSIRICIWLTNQRPRRARNASRPSLRSICDFLDRRARLAELERRGPAGPLDVRIHADADQVGRVREPEPAANPAAAAAAKLRPPWAARGRQWARPRHGVEHEPDVLRGAGEGAGYLEGVPQPVRGPRGHQARRRPEPDDPAERCGDAQRAAQIGPLGQRDHACGQRGRAAAGGAARAPLRVPRIPGAAEDLVEGVAPRGELGAVGLAEDDGAGLAEAPHHERVLGRGCGRRRPASRTWCEARPPASRP